MYARKKNSRKKLARKVFNNRNERGTASATIDYLIQVQGAVVVEEIFEGSAHDTAGADQSIQPQGLGLATAMSDLGDVEWFRRRLWELALVVLEPGER